MDTRTFLAEGSSIASSTPNRLAQSAHRIATFHLLQSGVFIAVLLFLLSACTTPKPGLVRTSEYHSPTQTTTVPAVSKLHRQAIAAINQSDYQLSINTLQRAVKISPRDPWSWHYLAQSYWHLNQHEHCQQMLARAIAYAPNGHPLNQANQVLQRQCRT